MSWTPYDQWGRRTSEEWRRDHFKAQIKRDQLKRAAGTTPQPKPRRTTSVKSDSERTIPPGYTKRNREYRQRQIEMLRKIYGTEENNDE